MVPGVTMGQTLAGTACPDPNLTPVVADHFLIVGQQGRAFTVTMTAAFTSSIKVFDATGAVVASAVAPGGGQAATLQFTPSVKTDAFAIQFGSTSAATGAYTMSVN